MAGKIEHALRASGNPNTGTCVAASALDGATRRVGGPRLTDACQWTARRRTLARVTGRNEARLYSVLMYTGDPTFKVVGEARMVRALRC